MRFHVNQHIFCAAKACSQPKTPVLVYKAAHLLPFLLFATLVSTGQAVLISADFESDFPAGWDQQTLSTDGGWLVGSHTELQSQYFPMTPHGQFIATRICCFWLSVMSESSSTSRICCRIASCIDMSVIKPVPPSSVIEQSLFRRLRKPGGGGLDAAIGSMGGEPAGRTRRMRSKSPATRRSRSSAREAAGS